MIVWHNDRLIAEADVRISPFDHGITVGNGVFETLRVYAGTPFAWDRHLVRLQRSAAALGLVVPDGLRTAAQSVIDANGADEARLRVTITGGEAPLGSEAGTAPPTVLIATGPVRAPQSHIGVAIAPWTRNVEGALTGLKTTSYGENVRALAAANARGCEEALLLNTAGNLCEGTGTNAFVVRDGQVITPPLSSGCLAGITRAIAIERCGALGIPCTEADITADAIADVDELFVTGSLREVTGVAFIDGVATFDAPGPITARIAEDFREYARSGVE
jgi:branched-chain amino acid aminotransferase